MNESDPRRRLPAVHEAAARVAATAAGRGVPAQLVTDAVRRALDDARAEIRRGAEPGDVEARATRALEALARPSLRRVVNATGVVLHTNLGRAPLGPTDFHAGYTNLEFDLTTGRRGKRDTHTGALLESVLGAPAVVVNNNAAAVWLALHELAAGGEVVVSRGELIEIGDGFRIPDIMLRSGAVLRETGTTNRTRIEDYRDAITERTRLLMRVHPSNFHISGFTARPELSELAALGRERGIPVYEDLGSGCLTDLRAFGIREPLAQESLRAGADLISFSGDKLMGGPQAGILAGRADLVERLRRNPMFRALRIDKLIAQALEITLRRVLMEEWERIPALAMIRQSEGQIRARAERLAARVDGLPLALAPGESVIGGGATPEQRIPTCLIALTCADPVVTLRRLRENDPPVIARIEDERVLLDLRTVFPEEEEELVRALQALS